MEQISNIASFVLDSFIHIWPYLIITIPLAVFTRMSGASRYINKVFSYNQVVSVFLATLLGAISPFCSCGVIPLIASLLMGGVPLAPVMAFWIASPSMDPEIFFLSVATIGWKLSVWRLAATFAISLLAGYLTHVAWQKGLLGQEILREGETLQVNRWWTQKRRELVKWLKHNVLSSGTTPMVTAQYVLASQSGTSLDVKCCVAVEELRIEAQPFQPVKAKSCDGDNACTSRPASLTQRIVKESWNATFVVVKFMALAFIINALIQFYVPQDFISDLLGGNGSLSVVTAVLVGVPVYTSNITALPLISGLLSLGMNQGAALAFLVAGPATTLPAIVAVWGIVRRRIFLMYLAFVLSGALLSGLLFNLIY